MDTISKCCASGSVTGLQYVGGLVGANEGAISKSYSLCTVTSPSLAGGLVGENHGPLSNVYSAGVVIGEHTVGGLVGRSTFTAILNAFSICTVIGDEYVGGLMGFHDSGGVTIRNSFATGAVDQEASDAGGLVGRNLDDIVNSFWDVYRSGQANCCGSVDAPTECTPKNAGNAEPDYWFFKAHSPIDAWDFTSIWGIQEGISFPYLQWQELCDAPCSFLGEE